MVAHAPDRVVTIGGGGLSIGLGATGRGIQKLAKKYRGALSQSSLRGTLPPTPLVETLIGCPPTRLFGARPEGREGVGFGSEPLSAGGCAIGIRVSI